MNVVCKKFLDVDARRDIYFRLHWFTRHYDCGFAIPW